MTEGVPLPPFDGLEGDCAGVYKGIGDTRRVPTTQMRVHGEDGKVWKPLDDLGNFLSFGILFEYEVVDTRVPHREVYAPDVMAKPNIRVAPLGRVTKSCPSSGDPTGGTQQNSAV